MILHKHALTRSPHLARIWRRCLQNLTVATNQYNEKPRINQVGVQYLGENLHKKIFPKTKCTDYLKPSKPSLLELAKEHLEYNELLGKKTQITDPIDIENFPNLEGNTLDEHFYRIGTDGSQPYLSMAENFLSPNIQLPTRPAPSEWLFKGGWVRYSKGEDPREVPYPLEDELVFDVEVIYKKSPYAVLATCASSKAWYGWVSPFLINYAKNQEYNQWEHLIPFDSLNKPKLIIGYNVSYDRARVLEEYNIKQSKAFFLDGMALHVAISGICSQQRPTWHKHKKSKSQLDSPIDDESNEIDSELDYFSKKLSAADVANELVDDPWLNKGSPNSLTNVADFHCNIKLDKSDRDYFSTEDPMDVVTNFNNLMDYCAKDVEATYLVTAKLFPQFRQKVPHPVSFAALRHLGTLMLPTTTSWDNYIETAERVYQENRDEVTTILKERANAFVSFIDQNDESLKPEWENDPWLSQLNWTFKEPRIKKNGEPAANQAFLTGYPEWYRELFKTVTINGKKQREMNISTRTRITPLLLKLKWEGYPLLWTDSAGWSFKVPFDEATINSMEDKGYTKARLSEEDMETFLPQLRDGGNNYELFKVPHPDGPSKRCTSILSKSYLRFFESGVLTSEYSFAQEILTLNSTASYWMGNRQRIMDQFVIYSDPTHSKNKFFNTKTESKKNKTMGIILPKLCTMGTITRRATENTWLTASNSKKNRIGSELKAMIQAPDGYVFVGADVDSEELWIASLVGDSMFGMHGSTALGWMTLEGDKSEKTDLHSKTAEILGILRNDAKVFNYGRIYGAGVKFATRLLKQCNSNLSDDEAELMAKTLYAKTKGQTNTSKFLERRMYHGGTESIMFNALESIAYQEDPKTPVLGAAITDALTIGNLNKNNYLTSRINWVIQSSGVDYLHLLIVSMDYLLRKYKIDGRLIITVHDELRYMVKSEDRYKAALLLQISNLWTRAMFCEQLGINEVPQSCAFFSEIDVDKVLRKEVTLDCITPSHPTPIPPGESLDIRDVLKKANSNEFLKLSKSRLKKSKLDYPSRDREILSVNKDLNSDLQLSMIKLQNSIDKTSWRKNMNNYIKLKKEVEFDKFNNDFDRRNMMFELAKFSVSKAKSTAQLQFKSKPRNRKMNTEYDIGGNGDDLLAEEIGKFNRNTSRSANQTIKATRKSVAKVSLFTNKPGSQAKKLPSPASMSSKAKTSLPSNTISKPPPAGPSSTRFRGYKSNLNIKAQTYNKPLVFSNSFSKPKKETLVSPSRPYRPSKITPDPQPKNSTSRLSQLFFNNPPLRNRSKSQDFPLNRPSWLKPHTQKAGERLSLIQQSKDPPVSQGNYNLHPRHQDVSTENYTRRNVFYTASSIPTHGNGISKH